MKFKFQFGLLLTVVLFAANSTTLVAQNLNKEIEDYTQKFQAAYNKADHAALTALLTADAVRTNADGTVINGAAAIGVAYAQGFSATDQQVDIKITKITPQSDNKVLINGTFSLTGTVKANGEKIAIDGTYENTALKENGVWKISIMKLMTP